MGMVMPDSTLDQVLNQIPEDTPADTLGDMPIDIPVDRTQSNVMKYLDFIGQMKGMNPIERIPMILKQFGILR